jgi:hypothetical protein
MTRTQKISEQFDFMPERARCPHHRASRGITVAQASRLPDYGIEENNPVIRDR